MYKSITKDIHVEVLPAYDDQYSEPHRDYYYFSYTVKITNKSPKKTQLIARHWVITDGSGQIQEIKGPGVIGEQPFLEPGETYIYQSACPLDTPTGNMRGSYQMKDDQDGLFDITIPLFFLRHPDTFH